MTYTIQFCGHPTKMIPDLSRFTHS